jgi:fructose-1-phosphate kinase PfkB-like protein
MIGIFLRFWLLIFTLLLRSVLLVLAFLCRMVALLNNKGNKLEEEDLEMSGKGLGIVGVHINNGGQVAVNVFFGSVVGDFFLELFE